MDGEPEDFLCRRSRQNRRRFLPVIQETDRFTSFLLSLCPSRGPRSLLHRRSRKKLVIRRARQLPGSAGRSARGNCTPASFIAYPSRPSSVSGCPRAAPRVFHRRSICQAGRGGFRKKMNAVIFRHRAVSTRAPTPARAPLFFSGRFFRPDPRTESTRRHSRSGPVPRGRR